MHLAWLGSFSQLSHSSAIFYSLAGSCFAKRVNAYFCFQERLEPGKEASCYLDMEGKVQVQTPCTLVVRATLPPPL